MNKLENLKQVYWNELQREFPDALLIFWKWFETYKVRVGWNELFYKPEINVDRGNLSYNEEVLQFDDIPLDFQNAILTRFQLEHSFGVFVDQETYIKTEHFKKMFSDLQAVIDTLKYK